MLLLSLRRLSNETHAVAARKQEQMERMRKAFGLGEVRGRVECVCARGHTKTSTQRQQQRGRLLGTPKAGLHGPPTLSLEHTTPNN